MRSNINCVKVNGHPNLVKDLASGAILNIDNDAMNMARMKKKSDAAKEKELVELKNDVSEIKKMLAQLTEKMVESNG